MLLADLRNDLKKKLERLHFSAKFQTTALKVFDPSVAKIIAEKNALNVYKITNYDYFKGYTPETLSEMKKFMILHHQFLIQVEQKFDVPKEVITSLLWIETKLGKRTGQFNVLATYCAILMSNQPELLSHIYKEAIKLNLDVSQKFKVKLKKRMTQKSQWAVSELKKLEKMMQRGSDLSKLDGSYAGAFGITQFLPSSYLALASSPLHKIPDLYDPQDAIWSVANYLKKAGWKNSDKQSKKKALLRYNNALGYVAVILTIATDYKNQQSSL